VKIRSSPQRREKFTRHADAANIKNFNLILDVSTHWNSTYDMLERALKMREVNIYYIFKFLYYLYFIYFIFYCIGFRYYCKF